MSKFKRALREIAKREGISRKEVYREMQAAVNIGYASTDPAVRAAWNEMPLRQGQPRPEDVFKYCCLKVRV